MTMCEDQEIAMRLNYGPIITYVATVNQIIYHCRQSLRAGKGAELTITVPGRS